MAIDDAIEIITGLMCDIAGSIKSEQRQEWRDTRRLNDNPHPDRSIRTARTLVTSDNRRSSSGVGYQLRPTHVAAADRTVCRSGNREHSSGRRVSSDNVRAMGPPRERDQIEISRTDEFELDLEAPVRISGDLAGHARPHGGRDQRVDAYCSNGVISARRHIHMNAQDAAHWASGRTVCRSKSTAKAAT